MKPVTVRGVEVPPVSPSRVEAPEAGSEGSFPRALASAVQAVEATQLEADAEASKLAHGAGNLHETMLSLEKADVVMKVALKVRNKVLDAYNEVMRMSV